MFVVYVSSDEVLVTTERREKKFLAEFFGEDLGRITRDAERAGAGECAGYVDIYDRITINDLGVQVSTRLVVRQTHASNPWPGRLEAR